MKNQSASTSDGMPKGMPKGQHNKIDQMNNPKGVASLKDQRNTGKVSGGTAFLRGNKHGVK